MFDKLKLDEVTAKLCRDLTDKGKLIEAGWISLRSMALAKDAPEAQYDDMRTAFFAGAQHMFGSMMSILDPGDEPTDADLRRMDQINAELNNFIKEFEKRISVRRG